MIVMKFGGASLASPSSIKRVASPLSFATRSGPKEKAQRLVFVRTTKTESSSRWPVKPM